jgi:hypothetical protein
MNDTVNLSIVVDKHYPLVHVCGSHRGSLANATGRYVYVTLSKSF